MSEVKQERLQNRLGPEIKEFREACQTLQLATVDANGKPNVSYAPFALLDDGYYGASIIRLQNTHVTPLENPQVSIDDD